MGSGEKKGVRFRRLFAEMKLPWSESGTHTVHVTGVGRDGKWTVVLEFVALEGDLYCYSVRVEPDGLMFMKSTDELPAGGVTSRVLSSIGLEESSDRSGSRACPASLVPGPEPRPAPARPKRGDRPGR
jgi:hypothetical protein